MPVVRTYINNVVPHPSPQRDENSSDFKDALSPKVKTETLLPSTLDLSIKIEGDDDDNDTVFTDEPFLKGTTTALMPLAYPSPLKIEDCLDGCLTSFDFGEIAHYYRDDSDNPVCPFRPTFTPYNTLPVPKSCKVVVLRGGTWFDVMVKYHCPREWMPCWMITTTSDSRPRLYISGNHEKQRQQIGTVSKGGVDKTNKWEPGSAVVVEQYPRIIPKRFLHRIQEGKRVVLNKRSCAKVKIVFGHRFEIFSDGDVEACLENAKY